MFDIGLTSVTFRTLKCEDIIAYSSKCGLSCIEWGSDIHVPETDLDNACNVRQKTIEAKLYVSSYGSYYRTGENPTPKESFEKYIEVANCLDAPIIRIWAGSVASRESSLEYYKKIVDETALLCDMAKKNNITLAYEFHNDTLADCASGACQLVKDVSAENLGLYFQYDPLITNTENYETLKKILPYLKMVHVFNVDKTYTRYSLREKDGLKLWGEFINIIKSSGVSVNMLLEFLKERTFEELENEVLVLKELIHER